LVGTFVGYLAGQGGSGDLPTCVGAAAGNLSTGRNLTAVGVDAGKDIPCHDAVAIGVNALKNQTDATSDGIVAIGYNAGHKISAAGVAGYGATYVGVYAGYDASGDFLTAIGDQAGKDCHSVGGTFVGTAAGVGPSSGDYVTALGFLAGKLNTGANCLFLGYEAGLSNSTASQFIVKQNNVNTTPLIQGDFSTGAIGLGGTADASAILDCQSTSQGVRFPNMTQTQRLAISSPAAGLQVYDSTNRNMYFHTGVSWVAMS
jgi:hypothetical protein